MRPKLTFAEYLKNPSGKGSAFLARRSSILNDLQNRAGVLFKKRAPELTVFTSGQDYVFVFRIPSEELDKVSFDVAFKFTPVDDDAAASTSLLRYGMSFFSNAQNFVYTYAWVLNRDGWLVPELAGKINKQALKEEPTVRNPQKVWGYEKSTYFAALLVKEFGLMNKSKIARFSEGEVDWRKLEKEIKESEEKEVEWNRQKQRDVVERRKKRDAEKRKKAKAKKEKEIQQKKKKLKNSKTKPATKPTKPATRPALKPVKQKSATRREV